MPLESPLFLCPYFRKKASAEETHASNGRGQYKQGRKTAATRNESSSQKREKRHSDHVGCPICPDHLAPRVNRCKIGHVCINRRHITGMANSLNRPHNGERNNCVNPTVCRKQHCEETRAEDQESLSAAPVRFPAKIWPDYDGHEGKGAYHQTHVAR